MTAGKSTLLHANRTFKIQGFAGEPENRLGNASKTGRPLRGKSKTLNPNGIHSTNIRFCVIGAIPRMTLSGALLRVGGGGGRVHCVNTIGTEMLKHDKHHMQWTASVHCMGAS